jgi:uncharacterized protein (DUF305 family)
MSRRSYIAPTALAAALLVAAGCASAPSPEPGAPVAATDARVVAAGAPGEASRVVTGGHVAGDRPRHTAADAAFMQHMIAHHLQAVEMTAMVEARTEREDIRMLARRIDASQADEIAQMRRWLEVRGEHVPGDHAHHGDHSGMPGMLSPAELARLAGASGAEFDRLFLESMIRHHEGALVMVADLFATHGAGQEAEIFQFATHVDSDQRVEITRMRRMLAAGP